MQVSHHEDHVTHAVIGPQAAIAVSIEDSAEFMHMMTATIYSDQPLAVVREVLCNAWDAHIDSKRQDIAITVTINEAYLIIKDVGHGIPHAKIGSVYGRYGGSTKKNDGHQTGGFGLGSKAPWAYTDSFEVTSCCNGVKTIYIMGKSSGEVMGKPSITPLMSCPTTETGLTVKIPLKHGDFGLFDRLVRRIISNGEMNATINGVSAETIPFSAALDGYLFTSQKVLQDRTKICIRYGNVIYPLSLHTDYKDEYQAVLNYLRMMNNVESRYGGREDNDHYTLVLQAAPNSISVTPSRESLSMQTHTIEALKKLLHNTHKILKSNNLRKDKIAFVKAQVAVAALTVPFKLLNPVICVPNKEDLLEVSAKVNVVSWSDFVHVATLNRYPEDTLYEDIAYRLAQLIEHKVGDRGLLQAYLKMVTHLHLKKPVKATPASLARLNKNQKWRDPERQPFRRIYRQHVLGPLATDMKADKLMSYSRVQLYDNRMSSTHNIVAPTNQLRGDTAETLLAYLRKTVVLYSNSAALDTLRNDDAWEKLGPAMGTLIYKVQPSIKYVQAAIAFFKARGFTIVDRVSDEDWMQPVENRAPRVPVVKREPVVKLQGYIALKTLWLGGSFEPRYNKLFEPNSAAISKTAPRITEPKCFLTASSSDARNFNPYILTLRGIQTQLINQLFGDVCAVAISTPQANKFHSSKELGGMELPTLEAYAAGHVINQVTKNPNFLKYWSMCPKKALTQFSKEKPNDTEIQVFSMLMELPEFQENFGYRSSLTTEEKLARDLWELDPNKSIFRNRYHPPHNAMDCEAAIKLIKDIPIDPRVEQAVLAFKTNPLFQVFDLAQMKLVFASATGSTFERHRAWLLKQMIKSALSG